MVTLLSLACFFVLLLCLSLLLLRAHAANVACSTCSFSLLLWLSFVPRSKIARGTRLNVFHSKPKEKTAGLPVEHEEDMKHKSGTTW